MTLPKATCKHCGREIQRYWDGWMHVGSGRPGCPSLTNAEPAPEPDSYERTADA